jgi:hypothetical protein
MTFSETWISISARKASCDFGGAFAEFLGQFGECFVLMVGSLPAQELETLHLL